MIPLCKSCFVISVEAHPSHPAHQLVAKSIRPPCNPIASLETRYKSSDRNDTLLHPRTAHSTMDLMTDDATRCASFRSETPIVDQRFAPLQEMWSAHTNAQRAKLKTTTNVNNLFDSMETSENRSLIVACCQAHTNEQRACRADPHISHRPS
jgi:hypothetical protein